MSVAYDEVPVKQLTERYGVGMTSLYGADGRLRKVGVNTISRGRKAFVTRHQLEYLDKLDAHIKKGGTVNEFVEQSGKYQSPDEPVGEVETEQPGELMRLSDAELVTDVVTEPQLVGVLEAIAQSLAPRVPTLFDALEKLEQACEKGWLLPSNAIAQLIGMTPDGLRRHDTYSDLGFEFTKVRLSQSKLRWRITKPN